MTGMQNFQQQIPSSNGGIDQGKNAPQKLESSFFDQALALLRLPLPKNLVQKKELLQSIKNNFKNLPLESQMELQVFLGQYYTEELYTQTDSEIGKVLSSLFQEHLQIAERDFRSLTAKNLEKIWLGMLTTIEKEYAKGSKRFEAIEKAAHQKYKDITREEITTKSQSI